MTHSEKRGWDLMGIVDRILPVTTVPQLSLYGSLVAPEFIDVEIYNLTSSYVSRFVLPI